jgi:nucleotide-binding universal stress UspA family protein
VIAGRRGIPVTVVPLKFGKKKSTAADRATLASSAAEGAKEGHDACNGANPDLVEVSARPRKRAEDVVPSEAPKGYDIMFVGIEKMATDGTFAPEIDRIIADFKGPLALAIAGEEGNGDSGCNMLVPVNGTETARRGAEVAFALSTGPEGTLSALYVCDRPEDADSARGRRTERALLEDVRSLAHRYCHKQIKTCVRTDLAPHEAILVEAERKGCDLIVLGANRRVGAHLYLGQTAEHVLEKWKGAIVLVVV